MLCGDWFKERFYVTIKCLRWHGNAHFDPIALGLFCLLSIITVP